MCKQKNKVSITYNSFEIYTHLEYKEIAGV